MHICINCFECLRDREHCVCRQSAKTVVTVFVINSPKVDEIHLSKKSIYVARRRRKNWTLRYFSKENCLCSPPQARKKLNSKILSSRKLLCSPPQARKNWILRSLELSADTRRHHELSADTRRHLDLSADTRRHHELSADTRRQLDLSADTRRHLELSADTLADRKSCVFHKILGCLEFLCLRNREH